MRVSGRWNLAGAPMVYTSESPACALLESCVHIAAENAPQTFTLLRIQGPDIEPEQISVDQLPQGWLANIPATQQIGSAWLESHRSALLRVPCALVPETANYLLNPLHADAASFQIERSYEYPFDLRLKR